MVDYAPLKVPELKKLLQELNLPISGNKADLIARLQENDKKKAGGVSGPSTLLFQLFHVTEVLRILFFVQI